MAQQNLHKKMNYRIMRHRITYQKLVQNMLQKQITELQSNYHINKPFADATKTKHITSTRKTQLTCNFSTKDKNYSILIKFLTTIRNFYLINKPKTIKFSKGGAGGWVFTV